jgi:hypothetical protein
MFEAELLRKKCYGKMRNRHNKEHCSAVHTVHTYGNDSSLVINKE